MTSLVFLRLMFLIVLMFLYVSDTTAENEPYTQWGLPEGAKARLGKGGMNDITCSSDGALLAVASQIGIWIYDVQTREALALLTGDTGSVERVSFSPDGRTLASGGQDNTLRLWDVETQTEIGTLQGHTGEADTLFFSPDGRTLASRDDDNTLRLWDVATQTQIHTLQGYTGSIERVSFSPDGRTFASGGQDDIVRLWDVSKRTEIGRLQGHTEYVSSVSFSPGGKTIVSGSHDGTVRLWDVSKRTEIGRLQGHTSRVNSVVFSSDGKTLASGSDDNTVRLWDVDTQAEIGTLEGSSPFLRVSFSPDGQTIAGMWSTWSGDNVPLGYHVRLWDVATQTRTNRYNFFFEHTTWEVLWIVAAQAENIHTILDGHPGTVESVSFSPDGKVIAASDGSKKYQGSYFLRMWDVATLREIDTLNSVGGTRSSGIKNVLFSPDGKTIVSKCQGFQRVICLRDAATYTEIRRFEINSSWVDNSVFSPDGRILASADDNYWGSQYGSGFVYLWDMDTDTLISIFKGHTWGIKSVAFSPDGRTLATAGSVDATVRIWDVATQTEIGRLRGHTGWVKGVAFSPDGKTIVSGSNDGTVRIWDVATQTEIGRLRGHTGWVNSVAFNPDGKTIVSGSNDGAVRLWDVATLTEIGRLRGHTGWVNSVAFNPDGKTIVSGSNDGAVRLWDVATLTGMGSLQGHIAAINSVTFSPGGKTLASGSDDGTVLLWNITSIDHSNTPLEATALLLGGSLTAKIDPGNDVDYFSVLIEVRGQLTLWTTTTGTLETIGTLQNTDGTTFATNADENGTETLNFRIEQVVEPGTYYIKVESEAQKTGDYTLYAAFMPATDVNGDGVVDVLDLMIVAGNFGRVDTPLTADVNGDGEVNHEDIIAVLDALEDAAAAPAAVSTTESLQRWIDRAKQLNPTDAHFQKGIAVLENLLTPLRETETVPKATALLANYPNPFNPETWIPYQLATPADVTLTIYSVDGALVRTLSLGHHPAGLYQSRRAAYWDGRNMMGEPVASGVYFYTLTAGEFIATRKLLIRK